MLKKYSWELSESLGGVYILGVYILGQFLETWKNWVFEQKFLDAVAYF